MGVLSPDSIIKEDLPTAMIHADTYFPWTDPWVLLGTAVGEQLTPGARDAERHDAIQKLHLQTAWPRSELGDTAHPGDQFSGAQEQPGPKRGPKQLPDPRPEEIGGRW